jgi:hypothetical protein
MDDESPYLSEIRLSCTLDSKQILTFDVLAIKAWIDIKGEKPAEILPRGFQLPRMRSITQNHQENMVSEYDLILSPSRTNHSILLGVIMYPPT